MSFRAVIFDLGGVVLDSPLHAIAAYEEEIGIPTGFINRVVVDAGPEGGWSRLERGELVMQDFFAAFEHDCTTRGHRISAADLMARIGASTQPRPTMLQAIRVIRGRGLLTGALTNNWEGEAKNEGTRALRPHFDAFVESSVVGLRKPDPRIYHHACTELEVEPREAVFLDDIGRNLKAARTLGMTTVKVDEPEDALRQLAGLLGFPLAEEPHR